MSDAYRIVAAVAADILGCDPADLDGRSGVDVTDGWGSLQQLSILMALEEELGLRFEPDALATHKTIDAISDLVRSLTT